jgi:hypothetical protein
LSRNWKSTESNAAGGKVKTRTVHKSCEGCGTRGEDDPPARKL